MRIFGYDIRRPLWFWHRQRARRHASPSAGDPPPDCFLVASVSCLEVAPRSGLSRPGPRAGEPLDAGDISTFDGTCLFYDIFHHGDGVVMIGPPLLNLAPMVKRARIRLDGAAPSQKGRTVAKDRVQITRIRTESRPRTLAFDAGWEAEAVSVQPSRLDIFRGRKVLFGRSKDNDLVWIEDWIDYHARTQGVDAVLFYDNGSTKYTPANLLERIRSVPGIKAAVVVDWPYKFGARGPDFPGDYSQYVILEHGRRRFLGDAAGILQIDVDELIVCEHQATIFDDLDRSSTGAISFVGVWIDSVREGDNCKVRYRDFRYTRTGDEPAESKWAIVPRLIPDDVQLVVHGFEKGFVPEFRTDIKFRHFRAINTSWKYDRSRLVPYDPAVHRLDHILVAQMRKIGWLDPSPPAAARGKY